MGSQNSNVPYLAWVGEEQRLTKCVAVDGITPDTSFMGVTASFNVEDWSGSPYNDTQMPVVEPNTVRVYFSRSFGGVCATGDVVSLFPGMARIELDVAGPFDLGPMREHQFLVGWMTLNTPTLSE